MTSHHPPTTAEINAGEHGVRVVRVESTSATGPRYRAMDAWNEPGPARSGPKAEYRARQDAARLIG